MESFVFDIPPRLGGGTVVMRELLGGEFEDSVKAQATAPKGQELDAVVDAQSSIVLLTLEEFRGEVPPRGGIKGAEFWRSLTAGVRSYLIGLHDRLNTCKVEEVDSFFAAGKPRSALTKTATTRD